jgi:hypothetical protein
MWNQSHSMLPIYGLIVASSISCRSATILLFTNFLHMLALEFLCRAYASEALPSWLSLISQCLCPLASRSKLLEQFATRLHIYPWANHTAAPFIATLRKFLPIIIHFFLSLTMNLKWNGFVNLNTGPPLSATYFCPSIRENEYPIQSRYKFLLILENVLLMRLPVWLKIGSINAVS